MISYRDMTFCQFYKDCANAKDCHRPLTKEVKEQADKWWKTFNTTNRGAPICMFTEKPECHKLKYR